MRVIQTVNDTIRLLFNPKAEAFSLSDFLLVRDTDENFLGQVIEVYDDKFDQASNVAKIRLVYRIVNGGELAPYNNYTPSRECEVAKIKQSEIEKCINLNKPVISVGKSFKNGDDTKINLNFFNNNCIIMADKFEQTNRITENLAPKLAKKKRVLILDFSGALRLEGIAPFVAGGNFKMPLSSKTIEFIRQKVLLRAKLETQAILGGIFDEVKNFLEETEEDYIPYLRFMRVVQAQYKQTPAVELLVLISWLKKYARMNLFAGHKREFENVLKSVEKSNITLIDLSGIKSEWQKEYLEYLINSTKEEFYLFVRLNDNNINNDILSSIYLKKKNITFIPSFAYGFKKASYIMDYAQNYILMPTLNPKRDFIHANFQIQSLNKDSFMLFGEDTKDFIFVIENEAKHTETSPSNTGRSLISLNLQLDEITPFELKAENFEIRTLEPKKKRLQEEIMLADVLNQKEDETPPETEETEEVSCSVEDILPEIQEDVQDEHEPEPEIEETVQEAAREENIPLPEEILGEDELDYFEQAEAEAQEIEEDSAELQNETQEIQLNEDELEQIIEEQAKKEFEAEKEQEAHLEADKPDNTLVETPIEAEGAEKTAIVAETEETISPIETDKVKEAAVPLEKADETTLLTEIAKAKEQIAPLTKVEETETPIKAEKKAKTKTEPVEENQTAQDETETAPIENIEETPVPKTRRKAKSKKATETVENEDNGEILKEIKPEINETQDNTIVQTVAHKAHEQDETPGAIEAQKATEAQQDDTTEVQAVDERTNPSNAPSQDDELEQKFNEIINSETKEENKEGMVQINENVSINLNEIKNANSTEHKLPVFDDDDTIDVKITDFKEGEKVIHEKYGEGVILKIIKYGERCLIQIEFEQVGKRLLDPKITKLEIKSEV